MDKDIKFAHTELGKAASQIAMDDLNATFVGAFLDNLEGNRSNSVRSRNLRMTVIRSFFRYAAMEAPQLLRAGSEGAGHAQ
jgi:hypothetical protein